MHALEDLPIERLASSGDRLDRIADGLDVGLVVRGAIPPSALAAIVDAAAAGALDPRDPLHYRGRNFGPTLIVCGPDLGPYFETADALSGLRGDGVDVQALVHDVLGRLAGRPVRRPRHPNGRAYAPLGLRSVAPDGSIALHCERETLGFPCMADLTPQLDGAVLSFYTALALPEAGGELEIYPLAHGSETGAALQRMERRGPALEAFLAPHRPIVARVGVGDLLVFDAGRFYHRVTPVRGARARWTLGGFVARAAQGPVVYAWN